MAVKASATVTLSSVVDVKSVWRYYKLQVSTLSEPSKPTTNPPSGWMSTEPSYTEGSTNSLYFCDLTVFCDDTFVYSDVSLSSSYEAAKAAYNKAVAADDKAQNAKDTVDNMEIGGRNLFLNSATFDGWTCGRAGVGSVESGDAPDGSDAKVYLYDYSKIPTGTGNWSEFSTRRKYASIADGYKELAQWAGKMITFTMWEKTSSTTPITRSVTLRYYSSETSGASKSVKTSTQTIVSTDGWKLMEYHLTVPAELANYSFNTSHSWYVYLNTAQTYADMTLRIFKPKMELGNKPTDWTPAPEDVDTEINNTRTEMTQTSEEIRMDFTKSIQTTSNELQSKIDSTNSSMNTQFTEINKYIRFVDGKIVLGETGNELMLTIQNDRVSFTQSGVEVAYFSNNNLYIKKAEVLTTLRIGNYEFAPRNDGGMALRKRSV